MDDLKRLLADAKQLLSILRSFKVLLAPFLAELTPTYHDPVGFLPALDTIEAWLQKVITHLTPK